MDTYFTEEFNTQFLSLATNPPTNASGSRVDKTWANLMWATDRYTVNMCNIDKISVTCTSSDTEKWVVAHQEVAVNVGDSNSRPNVATNVTDLSEFTNYSCVAVVTNSGGDSEESEPYLFQTLEEGKDLLQFVVYMTGNKIL